jgi:pantoate--beta-alanine ligase
MRIIQSATEMQAYVAAMKNEKHSIGFVPTMGALHQGHVTLAEMSVKTNDVSIVSIFVNPTQFNDKKDLDKYTRDLEGDAKKLSPSGIDVIFAPTVEDIYPHGTSIGNDIDLGGLDIYMEGPSRPGHFKGMAQVVKRLLDITTPDQLYMGQKDFQQFTIVAYFLKKLKIPTKLVVCPIIRETNGLAMSSRNERLSTSTRDAAGCIYKTLSLIKRYKNKKSVLELIKYGTQRLNHTPFEVEYISIVNGDTLDPILDIHKHKYVVCCTVVRAEGVRLLDNIILKK